MLHRIKKAIYHYFVPHESNNYRARTIHHSSLIFYILLLLLFQSSFPIIRKINPNILGYATNINVERIIEIVNIKRKEVNIGPLIVSAELSEAATKKASDMFSQNYWAHVSPTGITPWVFITQSGYDYVYAGENLAKSFNTSEEVVEAWMNSQTHRANILKPEYTDIGIAVMNGALHGEDTTLVVQEFGAKVKVIPTPKDSQRIVNNSDNFAKTSDVQKSISGADISFSPYRMGKSVSIVATEILLVILLIDSFYIWKNKTFRVGGHSLAHAIFLAAIIGAMGATGLGVIL